MAFLKKILPDEHKLTVELRQGQPLHHVRISLNYYSFFKFFYCEHEAKALVRAVYEGTETTDSHTNTEPQILNL